MHTLPGLLLQSTLMNHHFLWAEAVTELETHEQALLLANKSLSQN